MIYAVQAPSPSEWNHQGRSLWLINVPVPLDQPMRKIFAGDLLIPPAAQDKFLIRSYLPGVTNPVAESLAKVLGLDPEKVRVDSALEILEEIPRNDLKRMDGLWKEPAIETLQIQTFAEIRPLA